MRLLLRHREPWASCPWLSNEGDWFTTFSSENVERVVQNKKRLCKENWDLNKSLNFKHHLLLIEVFFLLDLFSSNRMLIILSGWKRQRSKRLLLDGCEAGWRMHACNVALQQLRVCSSQIAGVRFSLFAQSAIQLHGWLLSSTAVV